MTQASLSACRWFETRLERCLYIFLSTEMSLYLPICRSYWFTQNVLRWSADLASISCVYSIAHYNAMHMLWNEKTYLLNMVNPLAKTWMCSLCGQGFTRRTSARRHNDHLHSAQSIIMRPTEYLVGRLQGQLPSPQDPLNYRRPGPHHLRNEPSMIAHDNYGKPNPPPNDNFSKSSNPNDDNSSSRFESKYLKNSHSSTNNQLSISLASNCKN